MSIPRVPEDSIPIFVQEPFVGRTRGQGEREITPGTVGQKFWLRNRMDQTRILRYLRYEALKDVKSHYDAFVQLGVGITPPDRPFWLAIDFFGMLARLMRHYTFGPQFKIRGRPGAPNDTHVQRISATSRLLGLLNQSAEAVAGLGDIVFRLDVEDIEDEENPEEEPIPQAVVRLLSPMHYYPELDPLDATRVVAVTLAWVFPTDEQFQAEHALEHPYVVLFEIHDPGSVRYELWEWDGTKKGSELDVDIMFPELEDGATGINEIPIVHVGMGVQAGEFWGNSEFARIERIVLALENRLSQEDEVLDKHARPKLIVGPGVLNPEGRSNLADFDVIEIEPSILEKAVKPEYLTWNMQISAIEHELTKLEEYLFITTETSPASFGLERDGSQVESARALKFKAHRTVNKVHDLRIAFDAGVRDIFRIAQKLENAALKEDDLNTYDRGPIEIHWPDPIIEDADAETQNYVARKGVGLVSTKRAVRDLDDLTEEQADAEVQEILQDKVDASAAEGVPTAGVEEELEAGLEEELPEAATVAPIPPGGPPPPEA